VCVVQGEETRRRKKKQPGIEKKKDEGQKKRGEEKNTNENQRKFEIGPRKKKLLSRSGKGNMTRRGTKRPPPSGNQ